MSHDHAVNSISFFSGENVPLEMHKARMVQKINLLPIDERLKAIQEAGNNTFLLRNRDVFLDMLTDSGSNAMSDRQYGAMMIADDSYAGSETFYRLESALQDMFDCKYFIPAHQGRACEHLIANCYVEEGQTVLMNFHFTTTKAHITRMGGTVEELISDKGLEINSEMSFKGNIDMHKLRSQVDQLTPEKVAFIRLEAGTNLIGGQPISLAHIEEVSVFCRSKGITFIMDASLLADNLYFIKMREEACKNMSLKDITRKIGSLCDIIYFSARKLGCARGGGIVTSSKEHYDKIRVLVPLFEGFLTYGGMSVREMEALTVGLEETLDIDVISQTPIFVKALSDELIKNGVPVVTPAGGLGCHVDASRFVSHIPQTEYPAGALAAAAYIVGGIRGMERGTLSEQRNPDGSEHLSSMELLRLAVPKRVFTLSHMKYVADRLTWLWKNRDLIGGLEFYDEPAELRFFLGKLKPKGDWQERLIAKFKKDMPSGI